jgi:hypothetical protein
MPQIASRIAMDRTKRKNLSSDRQRKSRSMDVRSIGNPRPIFLVVYGVSLFLLPPIPCGFVQKEIPIAESRFRVLVYREHDRLNVLIAPALTRA